MDFDPRDYDSRDDDRFAPNRSLGGRNNSQDDLDRDDDWRQPEFRHCDQDDDARTLGRGLGNDSRAAHSDEHARDRHDDARWPERDRDERECAVDPRDVFVRHVHLPRGPERRLFAIATASTPCADPNPAPWRRSARFEWSPVVISEITAVGGPIRDQVTYGIFAIKG